MLFLEPERPQSRVTVFVREVPSRLRPWPVLLAAADDIRGTTVDSLMETGDLTITVRSASGTWDDVSWPGAHRLVSGADLGAGRGVHPAPTDERYAPGRQVR